MKTFQIRISACIFSICLILGISCKKNWLDVKPQKSLVVPTRIADYQALLDITNTSSATGFNDQQPGLDEVSAGDFYVLDGAWSAAGGLYADSYIWKADIYSRVAANTAILEWNYPYNRIFTSNIVLEGISKITPSNNAEVIDWNNVKGSALFFRAYNHYCIAQLFCKPYDKNIAATDLGIPLRLTSDINEKSVRSSVQQTYIQIINDLKESLVLLPVTTPINTIYKCRPNIAAVNAMLGRVYLAMSEYDSAFKYANASLQLYSTLMNYNSDPSVNTLPSATFSITKFNSEILFYNRLGNLSIYNNTNGNVDPTLFNSYDPNDLRQVVFFKTPGVSYFKGSYNGDIVKFSGLATDEVYLIRAECYARNGNKDAALDDLNALLSNRWKTANFVRVQTNTSQEALRQILIERRKELCFRGLRWSDLRRLNKEPQFASVLKRVVLGQTYELAPNDPKYVLPIPPDVIKLSGIQQNPR